MKTAAAPASRIDPGPLLDVFCGIGGLSAGFRKAGWSPVAAVDTEPALVAAYERNFGGAEGIVGDVTDPALRARLLRDYGPGGARLPKGAPRLAAVVGGPPCVGLSDANRNRAVGNPVNELPFEFARLAASLGPDLIVMEQSKNLRLLKTPEGDNLADRLLKLLGRLGYLARAELVKAEDYGVPQKRKRTVIAAVRCGPARNRPACAPLLASFPPPTTTAGRPVAAGRALKPPFSGDLLSGRDLELVKERDAMTKREVGGMEWYPRRAHTSMDLAEPSPTLRTYVHTAAGAFTLHDKRRGTYHKMGVPEMLALQTFPKRYAVPAAVTKARMGVGNAVPVRLAEHIARGLRGASPAASPERREP